MGDPLRVLLIEDVPDDAELVVRALSRGGFDPTVLRVDTALAMSDALDREPWDLVISDYSLPAFDAPAALSLLQAHAIDIPFIIVSGTMGEHAAVTSMKAGAHDYLNKGNLKRLVPAVARELQEARNRAEKRRAELALRHSEARFRGLIEHLPTLVVVHRDGVIIYANPTALRVLGYPRVEELLGLPLHKVIHAEDLATLAPRSDDAHPDEIVRRDQRWLCRDGVVLLLEVSDQPIVFDGAPAALAVAQELHGPLGSVIARLDLALDVLRQRAAAGTDGLDELERPLREAREAAARVTSSGVAPRPR